MDEQGGAAEIGLAKEAAIDWEGRSGSGSAHAPTFPLPHPPVTVRRFPLAYARVSSDYAAERDYALD